MERAPNSSFIVYVPAYYSLIQGSSFLMPSGFVAEFPRGCSNMIQIPNAWQSPGESNFSLTMATIVLTGMSLSIR